MIRFLTILLLNAFVTVVMAQNSQDLKDGYTIFRYPNGTISSEGTMKNGQPEGFWKSYYVTGILKSEGKRTNFLLDSIWVFYDQVGDTTEKISYLYGKKNGYYQKYKKDPSAGGLYLWSRELYAGDIKEGTAWIYFPDGKIQQIITYNRGKKEGLSREYDKEGNVITLFEYNNDFLVSRERINRFDSKGLKQGSWKDFYPDGSVRSETTYKDDRLHGYYKEYDSKGRLVVTMLYDNGSVVKSRVEDEPDIEIKNRYDDSGKLVYSGPYKVDVPVGTHREYDGNGKVINALIYNDNGQVLSEGIIDEAGNSNGRWKDYYPDGKIKAEGQYSDNRRTGQWRFYSISGNLEQTGSFNNGRPDGLWSWYYPGGELLREEEYFQGRRDGTLTEYSLTGEVITTGQYADGEKNDYWTFRSGDHNEEGNYIVGLKDGLWKSYYLNGKIKFRGSYIQGNPEGQHLYYYESGRLREEQFYRSGYRQKTWKKYDEEGNTILTVSYRDDVEVSINGMKINLPESDVKLIK